MSSPVCVLCALWFAAAADGARVPLNDESRAQLGRVLLVASDDASPTTVDDGYRALARAGLAIISAEDRMGVDRPAPPGTFEPATLDEVRGHIVAAQARLREFKLAEVHAALAQAERALLRLPHPAADRDLFADVWLLQAEVALAEGNSDVARRALRLLARVDPGREALHPGLYPPQLVTAYAEARADNARAEFAQVLIQHRPGQPAPLVTVDLGEHADRAPSLTTTTGPHLITLTAEGRLSRSVLVQLSAGQPAVLDGFLPPKGAAQLRAQAVRQLRAKSAKERARAALQLRTLCGADTLVVIEATGFVIFRSDFAREVPLRDDVRDALDALGVVTAAPHDDSEAPSRATAGAPAALSRTAPKHPPTTGAAKDPAGALPASDDESAGIGWPFWVGGALASTVLVGVGVAAAAAALWALRPAPEPPKTDRPVVIRCCSNTGAP